MSFKSKTSNAANYSQYSAFTEAIEVIETSQHVAVVNSLAIRIDHQTGRTGRLIINKRLAAI